MLFSNNTFFQKRQFQPFGNFLFFIRWSFQVKIFNLHGKHIFCLETLIPKNFQKSLNLVNKVSQTNSIKNVIFPNIPEILVFYNTIKFYFLTYFNFFFKSKCIFQILLSSKLISLSINLKMKTEIDSWNCL